MTANPGLNLSLRRIALLVLLSLAEASAIMPLILLLPTPLRQFDTALALGAAWLVILAVAATRRALALFEAGWNLQRIVMGGWLAGLLVAFLAGLAMSGEKLAPVEAVLVVELLCVLLLWWRGVSLGASDLQVDAARLRLQIGLLMFVVFATASFFDRDSKLFAFILPFLIGAVFAMPLSHLERVDRSRIGRHIHMDGAWWRGILIGAGIPLALSVVATFLITGDLLARGFQMLLVIILLPLLFLGVILGTILAELIRLLLNNAKEPVKMPSLANLFGDLQREAQKMPDAPGLVIPEGLRIALVVAGIVLFIAVTAYFTERARRRAGEEQPITDTLENVAEPLTPAAVLSKLADTLSLRRWLAAVTIRRIYARMGHEATKRGQARLAAQTPYDYIPLLQQAFPGAEAEVRLITDAYVAAHYGEVPDTEEELNLIREAWERARVNRARPAPPASPAR